MPEKSLNDRHGRIRVIELQDIDPSPLQLRKHFDEDKLKGLAASIKLEGLMSRLSCVLMESVTNLLPEREDDEPSGITRISRPLRLRL